MSVASLGWIVYSVVLAVLFGDIKSSRPEIWKVEDTKSDTGQGKITPSPFIIWGPRGRDSVGHARDDVDQSIISGTNGGPVIEATPPVGEEEQK
jgi:hypothetical protein